MKRGPRILNPPLLNAVNGKIQGNIVIDTYLLWITRVMKRCHGGWLADDERPSQAREAYPVETKSGRVWARNGSTLK